jgi:hypothetical protein
LGATLYGKGLPHVDWGGISRKAWIGLVVGSVVAVLSYLTMGAACSVIEIHIWDQCNKWRTRIAEISSGHNKGFTPQELDFHHDLKTGYKWVYLAMIIGFGSAIAVVLILWSHTKVSP